MPLLNSLIALSLVTCAKRVNQRFAQNRRAFHVFRLSPAENVDRVEFPQLQLHHLIISFHDLFSFQDDWSRIFFKVSIVTFILDKTIRNFSER